MQIDLQLKYPLHIRRYGNGQVIIVDMAWTEIATGSSYDQAYEIVRLANAAYKLMFDLSQKRHETGKQARNLGLSEQAYENPAKTPRDPGRSETEPGISDPAQTDSPGMRD